MAEIMTFGPVEDLVREQMTNCQQAEDGALAVLCADNHPGYVTCCRLRCVPGLP